MGLQEFLTSKVRTVQTFKEMLENTQSNKNERGTTN